MNKVEHVMPPVRLDWRTRSGVFRWGGGDGATALWSDREFLDNFEQFLSRVGTLTRVIDIANLSVRMSVRVTPKF